MLANFYDHLLPHVPIIHVLAGIVTTISACILYKTDKNKYRIAILVLSIASALIVSTLGYISYLEREKDKLELIKLQDMLKENRKQHSETQNQLIAARIQIGQMYGVIKDTVAPLFEFKPSEEHTGYSFYLRNLGKEHPLNHIDFKFQSMDAKSGNKGILYNKFSVDFRKSDLGAGCDIELPQYMLSAMGNADIRAVAFTTECSMGRFVQIMLLKPANGKWETVSRVYKGDSIHYETKHIPPGFFSKNETATPYGIIERLKKLVDGSNKCRKPVDLNQEFPKIKVWTSTDKLRRFRIELLPGANFVKLTERRKRGYELSRILPITYYCDSTICIMCPNDKLYFQFHQVSNKMINKIQSTSPDSSTLKFTWAGNKGTGEWSGLRILYKGIVQLPGERRPKVYYFKVTS